MSAMTAQCFLRVASLSDSRNGGRGGLSLRDGRQVLRSGEWTIRAGTSRSVATATALPLEPPHVRHVAPFSSRENTLHQRVCISRRHLQRHSEQLIHLPTKCTAGMSIPRLSHRMLRDRVVVSSLLFVSRLAIVVRTHSGLTEDSQNLGGYWCRPRSPKVTALKGNFMTRTNSHRAVRLASAAAICLTLAFGTDGVAIAGQRSSHDHSSVGH